MNFQFLLQIYLQLYQFPSGALPRCLDVIVREDLKEKVKPGEKAFFIGSLIVVPDVSRMIKRNDKDNHDKNVSSGGSTDINDNSSEQKKLFDGNKQSNNSGLTKLN
jgi:DNA replicative helicase MCM subunit Mcm2 (Cdc46/Mcm family)